MSIRKSLVVPFILSLSVLMLQGCATAILWGNTPNTSGNNVPNVIYTDQVSTFFKYKVLNSNNNDESASPVKSNGIGFEGEKHIYFLNNGTDKIAAISTKLGNIPMRLCDDKVLSLKYILPENELTNGSFKGKLCLAIDDITLTTRENKIISELGFQLKNDRFINEFLISGIMMNKQNVDVHIAEQSSLQQQYNVEFYVYEYKTKTNYDNVLLKVLTPATIAADIVTSPIQLIILVIIAANFEYKI